MFEGMRGSRVIVTRKFNLVGLVTRELNNVAGKTETILQQTILRRNNSTTNLSTTKLSQNMTCCDIGLHVK